MSTIHSDPEKYGLTLLKDHDRLGTYEFDQILIFTDQQGRLLLAHDSGCSCPLPFDGQGIPDLTEVHNRAEIAAYARDKWAGLEYDGDGNDEVDKHVVALLEGLQLP